MAPSGDLRPEDITPDVLAKFEARHSKGAPEECWPWTGTKVNGYGRLTHTVDYVDRRWLAHRISWVLAYGRTLPALLVIDHTCCSRTCVNPAHLEAVTQAENVQRGSLRRNGPPLDPEEKRKRQSANYREWWAKNGQARNEMRRKPPKPLATHCGYGHEFTPENTYIGKSGSRACRACKARRSRAYYYARGGAVRMVQAAGAS